MAGTFKVHCDVHGLTRTSSVENACPECDLSVVDPNIQEHKTTLGNPTEVPSQPISEEPEPGQNE